ncbi:styrene monooxygenase/indole monooxygenase family protein [Scopulibacillus cellulosilyticus]|uniref:Styrene monooxygenase/indole monooxygenase family protein n=1 Tax=Scopulibacillus cellulosilyticus TaxID=2665665 RepID=A0ABW2PY70_9BACL
MKKSICIIGSGTAGLQLAYALKENFDVTVIERRSPDQIRQGRIMSTQVHFGPTRNREKRFGMPEWKEQKLIESIHVTIGDKKLFTGMLKEPALSIDQRLSYSHYIEDLTSKGVSFRFEKVIKENIEALIDNFDLVIDCTGKTGPLLPFPIEEDLSPFKTPLRKCIVGYFLGIKPNTPLGVNVTVLPELGEMFEIPAITERGPVTILFITAVPNNKLDVFKGIKKQEEFTLKMKSTVQKFFPEIYKRIKEDEFTLCDENSFLQIAFIPVIRRPYLFIKNKLVVGCGDSIFLNDPITGQGSNLASYCAEKLYETLIEYKDSEWDAQTGESYWNRTKQYVKEVTGWTNAMAMPLPEHVIHFLLQGAQDQVKADAVAEWFSNPAKAYQVFFPSKVKQ